MALIGEQWLTISSNTGVRRLDDPRASMPNKGVRNRFRVLRQDACPAAKKKVPDTFFGPSFKKGVKAHLPSLSSTTEDIQYYDVTGRQRQYNPQTIDLRREVLLNSVWKELLEKPKEKK